MKSVATVKTKKIWQIAILVVVLAAVCLAAYLLRDRFLPGWYTENGITYYRTLTLSRASGIVNIDGKDYMFKTYGDHELLYGWCRFDGHRYYTDENGVIAKGERVIDGETYFFQTDSGIMYCHEEVIVGGKLWYFDDHGVKRFGIIELGNEKFCFSESGNLKTGLQVIDGKTYYFDPKNENMVYGAVTVGGVEYYFGEDGYAIDPPA